MNKLTYPLYILSLAIGQPKQDIINGLISWQAQLETQPPNFQIEKLAQILRLSRDHSHKFFNALQNNSQAKYFESLGNSKVFAMNIFEEDYPITLKHLPDPPLILYYRGNKQLLTHQYNLAIVGSRRATKYGELAVNKIVKELSGSPICVVSGLAYGIDAHAHQAALKNKLPTIAVLGSGLDDANIFPKENYQLAQTIIDNNGLLVSEYPPHTSPQKYFFVARNRIIAGLCQATLIAEAAQKSGALITADFAVEYNRQVFAIPGSILSSQSIGANNLINQGATPALSGSSILEEFGFTLQQVVEDTAYNPDEKAVLQYMQTEPQSFEELLASTKLQTTTLQATLSTLELQCKIKQIHPQIYQIIP